MHDQMMIALCGNEPRYKILRCLVQQNEPISLTEIATATGLHKAGVQRLLPALVTSGLVRQQGRPRAWVYQVPTEDPKLKPLLQLLDPTAYIVRQLRAMVEFDPEIEVAAIFGSIARGEERPDSDVDLLVIGEVSELDLAVNLRPLSREIGRPIHPTCYTRAELADRIANDSSFVEAVLSGQTIEIKGHIHDCTENPAGAEPAAEHPDRR